jgi:hypothetical protein
MVRLLPFPANEIWGQPIFRADLCFIQQVGGRDEWLVIKDNVSFESAFCGHMIASGSFDDFLSRIGAPPRKKTDAMPSTRACQSN